MPAANAGMWSSKSAKKNGLDSGVAAAESGTSNAHQGGDWTSVTMVPLPRTSALCIIVLSRVGLSTLVWLA